MSSRASVVMRALPRSLERTDDCFPELTQAQFESAISLANDVWQMIALRLWIASSAY
jgi:hypothetical protein